MGQKMMESVDLEKWVSLLKEGPTEGWSRFSPKSEAIEATLDQMTSEQLLKTQQLMFARPWKSEEVEALHKWRMILTSSLRKKDQCEIGLEVSYFVTKLFSKFEIPATEWREYFEEQAIPLMREYIAALIANRTKQELESIESRLSKGFYKEFERLKSDPKWGHNITSKQEW